MRLEDLEKAVHVKDDAIVETILVFFVTFCHVVLIIARVLLLLLVTILFVLFITFGQNLPDCVFERSLLLDIPDLDDLADCHILQHVLETKGFLHMHCHLLVWD